MVEVVDASTMDGDTHAERDVNALLTCLFVGRRDLPADECLSEARHILSNRLVDADLDEYLVQQFGPNRRANATRTYGEIRQCGSVSYRDDHPDTIQIIEDYARGGDE